MKILRLPYKAFRRIVSEVELRIDAFRSRFLLSINGAEYCADFISKGVPQVHLGKGARFIIGTDFRMNNGFKYNRIGRQQRCQFIVSKDAKLTIGDHVGMSSTAITCTHSIAIGDRVRIGGNVVIYDSDFHALDPETRADLNLDEANSVQRPVIIHQDVFIGAHSTILKGVTIGKGAIVGACSVVSSDIPQGEIWAGNPAKFVRMVSPTPPSKMTCVA